MRNEGQSCGTGAAHATSGLTIDNASGEKSFQAVRDSGANTQPIDGD